MLLLVADALAREVIVGTVVWGCRTTDHGIAVAFNATLLGLIVLGTRWFGLMRPRAWSRTVSEAMLVFIGGVCVANLLTFLFGASTLLAAGP